MRPSNANLNINRSLMDVNLDASSTALPLPSVLNSLITDFSREVDPDPIRRQSEFNQLQRQIRNRLTGRKTTTTETSISDSTKTNSTQALLFRLLSHPSFPRHRCSHLLILLESDELDEGEEPQYHRRKYPNGELSTAIGMGTPLDQTLNSMQQQQWSHLLTHSFIQLMTQSESDAEWNHMKTRSGAFHSSASEFSVPFSTSLCVVRLETQQLELPLDSRCGRLLVSALKWTPKDETTAAVSSNTDFSSAASSSTSTVASSLMYTDYASIAWPDMDFLAHNDPYQRGRIEVGAQNPPFPPPSSNRLLADIFPVDSKIIGPHCYSRISGRVIEEEYNDDDPYNIQLLTPPDSAFLLDAADSLNFRRFQCQGRSDQSGSQPEYYEIRHCVGVMIRLPPAPQLSTIGDIQLVRDQLSQLRDTLSSGEKGQWSYERTHAGPPPMVPSFSFAFETSGLDLRIVTEVIDELRKQLGLGSDQTEVAAIAAEEQQK